MRDKVVAAQGSDDPNAQAGVSADYQQLVQTVDQIANSASFQGVGMLNGTQSGDLQFSAGLSDGTLSLTPQNFTAQGLGLTGTDPSSSDDDFASLLTQVDAASSAVQAGLTEIGGQSDQIQSQLGVVSQLQSSLGSSDSLDADGARLAALSVQQMLASSSSGLANQAPQALLSLFRAS
jgi:flagellin